MAHTLESYTPLLPHSYQKVYRINILSCAANSFKMLHKNCHGLMVLMQSILEELYYGNIRLNSRIYGQDSPFMKAARLKHDNLEKLLATLYDSEKEMFENTAVGM